jgi:hypothetical protein
MAPAAKIGIGLAAVALLGWIHHGPLGNGERYIEALETSAGQVVAGAEVPGVAVRMSRRPLARVAILSGPADDFQRNGMGGQPGLTQMVDDVEGVDAVRWSDEGGSGFVVPLLAESLVAALFAYLIGLGFAWWLWGRKRRERFA